MVGDINNRKQAAATLEQQLAAIEATISGIAILNREGRIIYMNSAHAAIYGYKNATELIGQPWQVLYAPDELQRFEQEIMPHFFQEGHWSGEAMGKRRNGTTFQQEVSLTLMQDGGLVCVVQDITDRKQAEEALRIAEENYRSIFENALEGIFQSSPEGQFINVNPAMTRIFGYSSPTEMIESVTDIAEQLYVDPEQRYELRELLAQHTVKRYEFRSYCKDGSIIWIQMDGRAVKDNSGRVLYYEGILQDITDRKRREDELKRQLEELEIEIDQVKRARQVAEITQSDYFQRLLEEADVLRYSED